MKYEIKDHLIKRGYKEISKGLFSKNCKTIKLISNESILVALNHNDKVKHKHIVTCKCPNCKETTDTLLNLTWLD